MGDIEQAIIPYIKKKSLSEINIFLNSKNTYLLNQNYRNSCKITNYCNNFINIKMDPIVKSDEVFEQIVKKR